MKRLLFTLALLCSVAVGYAQVLNDVKPLGIPLGVDKDTALKILEGQEADIQSEGKEQQDSVFFITTKESVMGYVPQMAIIVVSDEKVAMISLSFAKNTYEGLRKACTQAYGEGRKPTPNDFPDQGLGVDEASMEKSLEKQITWRLAGTEEIPLAQAILNCLDLDVDMEGFPAVTLVYDYTPLRMKMGGVKVKVSTE